MIKSCATCKYWRAGHICGLTTGRTEIARARKTESNDCWVGGKRVKHQPQWSLQDYAESVGVSVKSVRDYVKTNNIDLSGITTTSEFDTTERYSMKKLQNRMKGFEL